MLRERLPPRRADRFAEQLAGEERFVERSRELQAGGIVHRPACRDDRAHARAHEAFCEARRQGREGGYRLGVRAEPPEMAAVQEHELRHAAHRRHVRGREELVVADDDAALEGIVGVLAVRGDVQHAGVGGEYLRLHGPAAGVDQHRRPVAAVAAEIGNPVRFFARAGQRRPRGRHRRADHQDVAARRDVDLPRLLPELQLAKDAALLDQWHGLGHALPIRHQLERVRAPRRN